MTGAAAAGIVRDLATLLAPLPANAAAVAVALAIILTGGTALMWMLRSRGKRHAGLGSQRRPRNVRSLAATGIEPAEIARRTGLQQDAVLLLLRTSPAGAAPQSRTMPAHSALRGTAAL